MNRTVKWILFGVVVIVAAFFGMGLSTFVANNASTGGSLLFTLAMFAVVVGIFAWLLSGNKKVALAGAAETQAALAMRPAEGKAGVYIMRKGFVGILQGFDFEIEGAAKGQAKGNQFLHAELAPGAYRITAKGKGNVGETQVSLAAGDVAVFRVILEPGMVKGSIVFEQVADPLSAKADLASIKMVRWGN
jgi:hypothetical protein